METPFGMMNTSFWQKVPMNYKFKQKLYVEMLKKNNYGNVWGADIPVNKKTITPKWLIPLDLYANYHLGFFGKKGKSAWKQFDMNFFIILEMLLT